MISWVRDKRLYYPLHSWQRELHVDASAPCPPKSHWDDKEHTGRCYTFRKTRPFTGRLHKNLRKLCPIGRYYSECQIHLPFLWRKALSLSSKVVYSINIKLESYSGTKDLIVLAYKTCRNMRGLWRILPTMNFPFLIGYITRLIITGISLSHCIPNESSAFLPLPKR